MNKFVLVIFICSVFLFSTIALAETWSSWTNEVKGCGGYSTTCDSCGEYNTISNDVSKTFTLPKGRWTVNIYANNIEASRTECCANMGCTGSIDCSVEGKSIKVVVTVMAVKFFQVVNQDLGCLQLNHGVVAVTQVLLHQYLLYQVKKKFNVIMIKDVRSIINGRLAHMDLQEARLLTNIYMQKRNLMQELIIKE
jgi:hypothetical protein